MCFACGYHTINHHFKIEYKHKNKTGVDYSFGSLTFLVCTLRCFNSLNTHTLIHKLHLHLCSKYGDLHTHTRATLNVCSKHGDLYTHTRATLHVCSKHVGVVLQNRQYWQVLLNLCATCFKQKLACVYW